MAIYLTGVYADPERAARFVEAYRASGKRMDVGKSCVRFKAVDDLPVDLIGETIAALAVEDFVALVRAARGRS